MKPSPTHLVILPTYNTGPRLYAVVAEVLRYWQPVLVVVDGSTDGSEQPVIALAETNPGLTVMVLPRNSGKGAAALAGGETAQARGFTHALVMDADGQHPAESIARFMAASGHHPRALVLGRPIFPDNIPAVRLHGRKLSVGLVKLELLGSGVADPLFGFRVYPLTPLLAVFGQVRGGRRYDFDTEAAVRLGWAGVPPYNLDAKVRYFSREEGGVSHFHYLRDNLTLIWLHLRLMTELLFWRWPAMLRHRRHWPATGMIFALLLLTASPGHSAEPEPTTNTTHRLPPDAPAWSDLTTAFANQPDVRAEFVERRHFAFKREAVELTGEVRVSATGGLSLHYLTPEERTVILDKAGVLMRAPAGQKSPPPDPRAAGVNAALLQILRFDLAALATDFELHGQRDADTWTLVLVPRTNLLRRSLERITVVGEAATIRHIELRRSARHAIEIIIAPPHPSVPFTAEELTEFFR
jgi:glycosyltransferase involved in cell wall biosynthesis